MEQKTTSKRPYLLRAYYDWLVDNSLTPYLVVNADYYGVDVPVEYVKDGQIVLNLSPNAVGNLALGNEAVQFNARFRGVPREIYIPLGAALAIYARENGDGVMFEPESYYDEMDRPPISDQPNGFHEAVDNQAKNANKPQEKQSPNKSSSHLRIIK